MPLTSDHSHRRSRQHFCSTVPIQWSRATTNLYHKLPPVAQMLQIAYFKNGAFIKQFRKAILATLCLSVCSPTRNGVISTECILVQFNIWDFLLQFIEIFQFRLASDKTTEIWPTGVYDLPQLLVFMTETGCVLCGAPPEVKETVQHRSPRKTDSECRVLTV